MENTDFCKKDGLFCLEKDDASRKKGVATESKEVEGKKNDLVAGDGDIITSTVETEPKPTLRLLLRKRKWEESVLPSEVEVNFRVFNFDSVLGASDHHDPLKKQAIECLRKICGRRNGYRRLEEICRGAFGAVYRARQRRTDTIVAMKALFDGATASTLREIDLLMSMRHPNIVDFKEVVADDAGKIFIIMEYAEMDLHRHIYSEAGPELLSRGGRVKILMRQLLEGVKFLHDNKVMHRDLKPSNLLINNEGVLKICDFGMSRRMDAAGGKYSSLVGTGRYRAPELMEGKETYTEAVDMWSVGCILAEMLLRMDGDAEAGESLNRRIFWIVASGDEEILRRDYFPAPVVTEAGFDLLKSLLSYEPGPRITAEAALAHVWFEEEEEEFTS